MFQSGANLMFNVKTTSLMQAKKNTNKSNNVLSVNTNFSLPVSH